MDNVGTNVDDVELAPITNDKEVVALADEPSPTMQAVSNTSKPSNSITDGPQSFYYGILIGLLVGLVIFGISGGIAGYYMDKSHGNM